MKKSVTAVTAIAVILPAGVSCATNAEKKAAVETVTPVFEDDSQYSVSGCYMK